MDGKYDGLQLIGAGGSKSLIKEGLIYLSDPIEISPVDPANHADLLFKTIQMHDIDEDGKLCLWQRPYAPLHGMDITEAEKRKMRTFQLNIYLEQCKAAGIPTLFTVPALVAEGCFPDKLDPQGVPLRFQVYRVPLAQRFPHQFYQTATQEGLEKAFLTTGPFSFLAGMMLKRIHEMKLAYMDGHIGNFSLLSSGEYKTLYIADLGSIQDIAKVRHPLKFKGFDVYTFMETSFRLYSYFGEWLQSQKELNLNEEKAIEIALELFLYFMRYFISGYFRPDSAATDNGYSASKAYQNSVAECEIFCKTYIKLTPQEFIDFFERCLSLYQATT